MNEYINFPKIECPFIRQEIGNRYLVTPEIAPGYEWVFESENVRAVDKIDGTNVCIEVRNGKIERIFNRENEKFIMNLHQTAWEGFCMEGIAYAISKDLFRFKKEGFIYGELIGPRINANRHKLGHHLFVPFEYLLNTCFWKSWIQNKYPKTFESISVWFEKDLLSLFNQRLKLPEIEAEGLVFYHPDGRMAKIRRDMFQWYKGEKHKEI